jgi:uncharacterized membrane protein
MATRIRWLHLASVAALFSMGACGGDQRTEAEPQSATDTARSRATTYVFECDSDYGFVAQVVSDTAWVFLPQGTRPLIQVAADSGARYEAGDVTLWTRGEQADFEVEGKLYRACRNDRPAAIWEDAKLRGCDFRAVGNEPGWHLEIMRGEAIVLVTDYGSSRYEFPLPEPDTDETARRTVYRATNADHELAVVLEGCPCNDTMSDESFSTTVTVTLDGREYNGCGRALH